METAQKPSSQPAVRPGKQPGCATAYAAACFTGKKTNHFNNYSICFPACLSACIQYICGTRVDSREFLSIAQAVKPAVQTVGEAAAREREHSPLPPPQPSVL